MRKSSPGRHWAAAACAIVSGLSFGSATASAQGFLDLLFGGGGSPSYPQQSQQRPAQPGLTTPGGKPYLFPSSPPSRHRDDDGNGLSSYGNFKTVCVRTCDGYYFPISNATTRKGFARDEARCQSSCGGGARLFHAPANQSTIDDAVDADGRAYAAMKTAFLYRKQKVEGCQCRSAPWSEVEQGRHRAYAEAEEASKPRQQPQAAADKIATNTTQPTAAAQETTVAATDKAPAATSTEPAEPKPDAESPKRTASKSTARSRLASDRPSAKVVQNNAKPPQGQGPVPVKIAAQAKAPSLGNPMGLGGGNLQWPGDAPPPQPQLRKRY